MLVLACADSSINKIVVFVLDGAIGVFSGVIITVSYISILMAILKIQTTNRRMKDFSTYSSHLAGVSIQYGTVFFIYVQPSTYTSLNTNKVISLFYTVMISMLNPLIYSLRNKEVKNALRRKVQRKHFSRDW